MTRDIKRARIRVENNFKQQMASHDPPSGDPRILIKEGELLIPPLLHLAGDSRINNTRDMEWSF
jgi:hypothetical protein